MLMLVCLLWLGVGAKERTAAEVQRLIATIGPRQTLSELNQNEGGWPSVLRGISSGRPEWLAIVSSLYPVADGGSSDDLGAAVQDAMLRNPSGVLELVTLKRLPVAAACGGFGSGLVDAPKARLLAALDERMHKVEALHGDPQATTTQQSCLGELRRVRDFLARIAP
jgi:hypothetical protein